MISVERDIIKDYNIIEEHSSIVSSAPYSEPNRALDHLKYICLRDGFDAIIYSKIEKQQIEKKYIVDLVNRGPRSSIAYVASGIPVKVKKQY
jgi:hypothetical protein